MVPALNEFDVFVFVSQKVKLKRFVKLGFFHKPGLFFALFPDDRIWLFPNFNGFPDTMWKLLESDD